MIKAIKIIDINIKTSSLLSSSIRGRIAFKIFEETDSEVRAIISSNVGGFVFEGCTRMQVNELHEQLR